MPVSKKQLRWAFANDKALAEEMSHNMPPGGYASLPEKAPKKKTRKKKK